MTRTELYELAVTTGKGLVAENSQIAVEIAIGNAAQSNKVGDLDFTDFKNYATSARVHYARLGNQLLPSEIAAKQAAAKVPGAAPAKSVGAASTEAHGSASIESVKG